MAAGQEGQHLQVGEARRTEMDPVRPRSSVAFQVTAQLSPRRFHRHKDGTFWRREAFGPQLEMVDDGFHAFAQLGARRWPELAVVAGGRAPPSTMGGPVPNTQGLPP